MSDNVPDQSPRSQIAPRKEFFGLRNPLALIGGFTALVEVALILGAIRVDDVPLRWAMWAFAVAAFFFVSHRAFWFLENMPQVLFAPGDYGVVPTIEAYRDAANRIGRQATQSIVTAEV